MRFIWILFFVSAIQATAACAQPSRTFVSAGINIGYLFGEGGGGVFGFEISATNMREGRPVPILGVAAKYDMWGVSSTKFHVAAELASGFGGVSFGPTWAHRESEPMFGYTGTVWTGLGLMPYYAYCWFGGNRNLGELGCYLKYPFQVAGEKLGWTN